MLLKNSVKCPLIMKAALICNIKHILVCGFKHRTHLAYSVSVYKGVKRNAYFVRENVRNVVLV